MGADARAYLYFGIPLSDIYTEVEENEKYEIHDQKTGNPTGRMGSEKKMFFVNKHTGKKYLHEKESLGIKEEYIHMLEQESDKISNLIIAVQVGCISDYGTGGTLEITPEEIDKAKAKFDLITTHHLLLGNGLCAVVKPKLMLNLYWSY